MLAQKMCASSLVESCLAGDLWLRSILGNVSRLTCVFQEALARLPLLSSLRLLLRVPRLRCLPCRLRCCVVRRSVRAVVALRPCAPPRPLSSRRLLSRCVAFGAPEWAAAFGGCKDGPERTKASIAIARLGSKLALTCHAQSPNFSLGYVF